MNTLLTENIEELKRICRKHQVKRLYAFGSVCTSNFNEKSDIDFIIAFDQRFFDGYVDNFLSLEGELAKLLNREVDLVEENTIQNPYFHKMVNQTKKLIYE